MTEITIQGDKELLRKLNKLQPRNQKVAMEAMGLLVVGKVKPYPPQPTGSTYLRGTAPRSEQLGKRWDLRAKRQEVRIFNTASYADYVQGERQAAWHSATGWQTLRKTVTKNEKALIDQLKKQIDRILEGR